MREFLFASCLCSSWLGIGLLIDDYLGLRSDISVIKAEQRSERSPKAQQTGQDSGIGSHQSGKQSAQHGGEETPKWTDVALAYLTFALAVATLALVMDAREKGRRELRAYLGIKEQGIRSLGDGRFQAFMVIENSGKTPAHDVRISFHVGIGDDERPEGGFQTGTPVGPMPLGPSGQRIVRQVLWDLQQDDIPRIAVNGEGRSAFVWGRVAYRDIYDTDQHLNFRFVTREISHEQVRERDTGRLISVRVTGWALQPTEVGNNAS